MTIHQILAGYADGDAISLEAAHLRDLFRRWGMSSDLFAPFDHVSTPLREECRPLEDYRSAPEDICLYHYGVASPADAVARQSAARKILIYHNITPGEYFDGIDDTLAARLREARRALPSLARGMDAVWADSAFNAAELRAGGVTETQVFPLLVSPAYLDRPSDPRVGDKFTVPLTTILFVGRIAPNKRVETLIEAFAWYHGGINPHSRLLIVGSGRSAPRYYTYLRMLANDFDLPNVCFEGFASSAGLAAYYELADLYVCPSAHEGYCLPLVEAMYKGVPVIARNVGGMPEALDGAGVLYEDLDPAALAALMHQVVSAPELRSAILRSQAARIERLKARPVEAELRALLRPWLPQDGTFA